jgi:hypothetical protein
MEGESMSEFVLLFRSTESEHMERMGTPQRAQQSVQAWLAWVRELEAKGHLKNPGQPLERTGKVVRKHSVVDGPFVEAKDVVLGFMVIEARDLDEAVTLSGGCPVLSGSGAVEIRPIATL